MDEPHVKVELLIPERLGLTVAREIADAAVSAAGREAVLSGRDRDDLEFKVSYMPKEKA